MKETTEIIKPEAELESQKPYTFRKLDAPDVFTMLKIISAIGINEFTACFEKEEFKNLVASVSGDNIEESASIVGLSVVLDVANTIARNLPKCEQDIYQILSQTSNLSVKEVKALDMVTFLEMIVDFIKKEEFKDFMKVVSKLLK